MSRLFALLVVLVALTGAALAGGPRLSYHSPQDEMRLVNRFRAARLPLRVVRVGAIRRDASCYAVARFLGAGASRDAIRRQALVMIGAAYTDFRDLQQLDLVADDRPETRERRPVVLFSISARRSRLALLDPSLPPGRRLAALGSTWFSPEVPLDPPPVPEVARALREALPHPALPRRLEARSDRTSQPRS